MKSKTPGLIPVLHSGALRESSPAGLRPQNSIRADKTIRRAWTCAEEMTPKFEFV